MKNPIEILGAFVCDYKKLFRIKIANNDIALPHSTNQTWGVADKYIEAVQNNSRLAFRFDCIGL